VIGHKKVKDSLLFGDFHDLMYVGRFERLIEKYFYPSLRSILRYENGLSGYPPIIVF